ncbi:killer toxin insensitive protein 3-like protein [Mitosporidium daphniae]|uniref:Killer toxin insensitive protein 3-like protein n=1 Tax=Mitosporidium daphniae TaxID=1485682 RepID=A0A098VXV5_9MICR|nr:killer toxin insensitive protein 3-like protein [Mitosporidium daphniae]KGG52606.1 killer toxin insensitive protein 3-like protein [Mitosporidium daphniae]|eukprot:XP_013239042.1 killer toxin insensitive protein 3-like protein [Mitosporidium daphniae]
MKSLLLSLVSRVEVLRNSDTPDDFRFVISSSFKRRFVISSQSKSSKAVSLFICSYDERSVGITPSNSNADKQGNFFLVNPNELYTGDKKNDLINSILDPIDESVLVFFSSGLVVAATANGSAFAVGIIEDGISQAQPSPDHEIFTVFSRDGKKLFLLAPGTLDTIAVIFLDENKSECPIKQPISIGWGSEKTQFRGTGAAAVERAAATATTILENNGPSGNAPLPVCQSSPPEKPISCRWHPDSSKFALILGDGSLRVYGRDATFLAKSASTVSLPGSPMAWKGQYGHGFGILAPHSVTKNALQIWEPNCLANGGFSYCPPKSMQMPAQADSFQLSALAWNSTNTILALGYALGHIQLWTTTCFQFDLKMELAAPPATTMLKMFWLDKVEDLLVVVRRSSSTVYLDMFAINMAPGPITIPDPNAMVIVSSGEHLRVTPCSLGLVPPPLSRWRASHPDKCAITLTAFIGQGHQIAALTSDASELLLFDEGPLRGAPLGSPMKISGKFHLTLSPGYTLFPHQLISLSASVLLLFATMFPNNGGPIRHVLFFIRPKETFVPNSNSQKTDLAKEWCGELVEIPLQLSKPSSVHVCDGKGTLLVCYADGSLIQYVMKAEVIAPGETDVSSKNNFLPKITASMAKVSLLCHDSQFDLQWKLLKTKIDAGDAVIQSQFSSCSDTLLLLTRGGVLWLVNDGIYLRRLPVQDVTSIALLPRSRLPDAHFTLRFLVTVQNSQTMCSLFLCDIPEDKDGALEILERHPCEPGSTIISAVGESSPVTLLVMDRGSLERVYMRTLLLEHMEYLCVIGDEFRAAYELGLRHRLPLAKLVPLPAQMHVADQHGTFQAIHHHLNRLVQSLSPDQLIQIMADRSATAEHRNALKAAVLAALPCDVGTIRVAIAADLLSDTVDEAMALFAAEWANLGSEERTLLVRAALVLVSREKVNAGAEALMAAALGTYSLALAQAIGEEGLGDRDPQEFMGFISKCYTCANEPRRRFLIDDRLGRSERALSWLIEEARVGGSLEAEGCDAINEIVAYVLKRDLYETVLFQSENSFVLRKAILQSYAQRYATPRALLATRMLKEAVAIFMTQGDFLGIATTLSLMSASDALSLQVSIGSTVQQSPHSILLATISQSQDDSSRNVEEAAAAVCSAMQRMPNNTINERATSTTQASSNSALDITSSLKGMLFDPKTMPWTHGWELALLLCLRQPEASLVSGDLLPALRSEGSRLLELLTIGILGNLHQVAQGLERHRNLPQVGEFDLAMHVDDNNVTGADDCSVISRVSTVSWKSTTSSRSFTSNRSSTSSRSSTSISSTAKAIARKKKTAAKPNSPRHEWYLINEAKFLVETTLLPLVPSFFAFVEVFLLCISRELGSALKDGCTRVGPSDKTTIFRDFLERLPHALIKAWDENMVILAAILENAPVRRRISPSSSTSEVDEIFMECFAAYGELRTLVRLLPRNTERPPIPLI